MTRSSTLLLLTATWLLTPGAIPIWQLLLALAVQPNTALFQVQNIFAAFDVFTTDGGTTWDAYKCGNITQFRGNFPDDTYTEDNRIQIASTMDGDKMFITWLDTKLEGATENNAPDVICPWY